MRVHLNMSDVSMMSGLSDDHRLSFVTGLPSNTKIIAMIDESGRPEQIIPTNILWTYAENLQTIRPWVRFFPFACIVNSFLMFLWMRFWEITFGFALNKCLKLDSNNNRKQRIMKISKLEVVYQSIKIMIWIKYI